MWGGIIVVQVFVCVHIAHLCVYVLVYERDSYVCAYICDRGERESRWGVGGWM